MVESPQLLGRLKEQQPLEGSFSTRGSIFHRGFSEGTSDRLAVSSVALMKVSNIDNTVPL